MSSKTKAQQAQQKLKAPPLTDPNNVPAIFANELSAIEIVDGTCVITFGLVKFQGLQEGRPPKQDHIAVARVALTLKAAEDLVNKMIGINRAMQQHHVLTQSPPNGPAN